MSKSEETKCRDECLNEAYVEDDIILGGACAADTFAGPGKDEWAPKAHARRAGFSKARKSSKTTSDLSKRVRQLERELLKKQTRGRKSKKSSRSKKRQPSESPCSSSDSSASSKSRASSSSFDSSSRSRSRGRDASKDRKPKKTITTN